MKFFGLGCASKKIAGQIGEPNKPNVKPRPPKASIIAPAIRRKEIIPEPVRIIDKYETCFCFQ